MLFPKWFEADKSTRLSGAAFGALSGVATGFLVIWCVSFAKAFTDDKTDVAESNSTQGTLESLASTAVESLTTVGMTVVGVEPEKAILLQSVVSAPKVLASSVNQVMKSEGLQRFMNNPYSQKLMATNDVGSLLSDPGFRALMAEPGMQNLSDLWADGKKQNAQSKTADVFMAEQLSFVWRRLQYLKHDPRVQEILRDPEVQALAVNQNPLAMVKNPKFMRLVGLVMDGQINTEDVDFLQFVGSEPFGSESPDRNDAANFSESNDSSEEDEAPAIQKPYQPTTIYKWRDEDGILKYSDYEGVPENKRNSAEVMIR